MNNKHIILEHLAQSKGLIRKDLVTFICINNGYDGHKQGYYGTAIQEWEREGYIQKVGKKWCIAPLGKTYLKNPKIATLKARVTKLTNGMANWKDNYYELKDASASTIQSLREANFDADNSDEIHILESKLSTSRNNEMLMEEEANRWLNQNKDTRDLLVKAQIEKDELEEALKDQMVQYNGVYSDYQDKLDELDEFYTMQVKYIEVRDELAEVKQKRNTLTLQSPPSTELGDFTKAELIKLIKGML